MTHALAASIVLRLRGIAAVLLSAVMLVLLAGTAPVRGGAQAQALHYPDLSVVIPPGRMAVVGTGADRVFQYTHNTFNGGPGPLVIQPAYSASSGAYLGTQYLYAFEAGKWTLQRRVRT